MTEFSEPCTGRSIPAYLRGVIQSIRPAQKEKDLREKVVSIPSAFVPFPALSDATLRAVFRDEASPEFPTCVRAALRTLEENYKDSSSYSNEARRGFWALAQLVKYVHEEPSQRAIQNKGAGMNLDEMDHEALSTPQKSPSLLSRKKLSFELHDVFSAIDKNDVDKIMAIRDARFELLLGSKADEPGTRACTPLEYAIGLGPKHERICLFIVGALSRYVNHLPEDKPLDSTQKDMLRKVRSNLKLAMDQSLFKDDTSLVASYLQVLVMSEGNAWLEHAIKTVRYELKTWLTGPQRHGGIEAQPLSVAHESIENFLTTHMRIRRKKEHVVVAAVDDYVANASSDLLLLALWSLLPEHDELPLYAFARDDRCTALFCDEVSRKAPSSSLRVARVAMSIVEALHGGLHSHTSRERWSILQRIIK